MLESTMGDTLNNINKSVGLKQLAGMDFDNYHSLKNYGMKMH